MGFIFHCCGASERDSYFFISLLRGGLKKGLSVSRPALKKVVLFLVSHMKLQQLCRAFISGGEPAVFRRLFLSCASI